MQLACENTCSCSEIRQLSMLSTANRVTEDPDLGAKYVTINGRKAAVLPTPDNYEPANLMGLP